MLSDYLKVDALTSLIFANAFAMSYETENFVQVFAHFGDNEFMLFLKHRIQVETLYEKKLLNMKYWSKREIKLFKVPIFILKKLSKNETIITEEVAEQQQKTLIDFLGLFSRLSQDYCYEENLDRHEFDQEMYGLLDNYKEISFVKRLYVWKLGTFETFFLLQCVHDAIESGDNNYNTSVMRTLNEYWGSKSISIKYINRLSEGKTNLNKFDLVETRKSNYRNSIVAKLSKNMLKILKETDDIDLLDHAEERISVIEHRNIKSKSLFYNSEETMQIETLKKALSEGKFQRAQKKLTEKLMSTALAVLLHGEPGTGKTESVYQIAKASGRNIFKVDISQTKTMWFGESEKLVKKIFTDYAELKKGEKYCPILLFNEADAVIGKRRSVENSNTAQTENAIQNILLEEMENFDGILMATTNLIENMDTAFERRFLYKVKFEKPRIENSAKIWKSKLPFLSENDCMKLAQEFQFSGGEMENIARKSTMHEILNDETPNYEMVKRFCSEEKWGSKDVRTIGFN